MSQSRDPETYEGIAFRAFVETLCCNGYRVPSHIPPGLENLTDAELTVLAYLEDVSQDRSSVTEPLAAAESPVAEEQIADETEQENQTPCDAAEPEPEPEAGIEDHAAPGVDESSDDEAADYVEGDDATVTETVTATVTDQLLEGETAPVEQSLSAPEGDASTAEETTDQSADDQLSDSTRSREDDTLINGPGGIPKTGMEPSYSEPDRLNLKNGRSRQLYEAVIEGYSDIEITDDGGTGLSISSDGQVSGQDIQAGEYTLFLKAMKQDRPVVIRARLSIIPDPRDLWKTIASDQDAPMAKPDQDFDCQIGDGLIVAVSKRGRSHAQEGKYRDDDFRIRADIESGWHILIVADGAGSAELSREGSKIACETVMAALPGLLAEKVDPYLEETLARYDEDPDSWATEVRSDLLYPVLPEAALRAAHAIEDAAAELKRESQEFSTTLVIAMSRKISGRWFTASFTVGDGGVALFDAKAETVTVMCRPDSGEFAGQTRFLASSEFRDPQAVMGRVFVNLGKDYTVLAAMTDGITDPKFPTDAAFANAGNWTSFWTTDLCAQVDLEADNDAIEDQMMAWLDFWSRGNHDDRTIALMMPKPSQQQAETEGKPEEAASETVAEPEPEERAPRTPAAQDKTDANRADGQ